MNIESVLKSPEEIQGAIINVSFPRSGHRFLREILSEYFGARFVFYESYTKKIISQSEHDGKLKDVNYYKTHDFHLLGRKALYFDFPKNKRYLVQIRHPLEAIASYYEFSLKHAHIQHDTESAWNEFLVKNLKYWKRFCQIWVSRKQTDSLLIAYHDLYADTYSTAEKAIRFLTNQSSLDSARLLKTIEEQKFLQYVGDERSKKENVRQLENFKYFDLGDFAHTERVLAEKYMKPNGIKLLFQ